MGIDQVRCIAALRSGLDCSEEQVPNEMIRLGIKSLTSHKMTKEEEAMGFMTRRKLKELSNWNEWEE